VTRELSERLRVLVDALPLYEGMRVLEIGCGPGAAARAVALRVGSGNVHAIDRSRKAIAMAISGSQVEIASGRLSFQQVAVENFELPEGEAPFDLAFAVRVGVLDGRHPELAHLALERVSAALTPAGRLLIDHRRTMTDVKLPR
jgi:cyclopropane fatty-acyl-phospholipid synthase-like methyltransferase